MKMISSHRRRFGRSAFTMVELMIGVALFTIVGTIAYSMLIGGLQLGVRNLSINKSDNSLRRCLEHLKRDINMAIEPPQLVVYTPAAGSTSASLVAVAPGVLSAQGIRIQVNTGPAYGLPNSATLGSNGLSYWSQGTNVFTIQPTKGLSPIPIPKVESNITHNDRLMFLYPPQSAAQPPVPPMTQQSYVESGATVYQQGRRIVSMTSSSGSTPTYTVTLENVSGQPLPAILQNNSAYVIHTVAYVAYTNVDSSGNPISRELRYFPNADDPSVYVASSGDSVSDHWMTLISDLDPKPQEQVSGATVQPFSYFAGSNVLNVNLPIRALDYAHSIAESQIAPGTVNGASEFNVFVSSKPQMPIKVKLD